MHDLFLLKSLTFFSNILCYRFCWSLSSSRNSSSCSLSTWHAPLFTVWLLSPLTQHSHTPHSCDFSTHKSWVTALSPEPHLLLLDAALFSSNTSTRVYLIRVRECTCLDWKAGKYEFEARLFQSQVAWSCSNSFISQNSANARELPTWQDYDEECCVLGKSFPRRKTCYESWDHESKFIMGKWLGSHSCYFHSSLRCFSTLSSLGGSL